MRRVTSISLKARSTLFLVAYTLILEGSVLAYFYYAGKSTIERQSREDVRRHSTLATRSIEQALLDSEMELTSLRLLLGPAPTSDLSQPSSLKPAEELLMSLPGKYVEIGVLDRRTRQLVAVRMVREFTGSYPVLEVHPEQSLSPGCILAFTNPSASMCVTGPMPGTYGYIMEIAMTLEGDGDRFLVAHVFLDSLLETIRRIPAPANTSALAADKNGLILYATDISLLGTYVRSDSTRPGFAPGENPDRKELGKSGPTTIDHWVQLRQPDIFLAVEKDCSEDFRRLRIEVISVALFAAVIAIVALIGIRALILRLSASLGRVTEVAQAVAGGDFSRRIDIGPRHDEIGLLVSSFNTMTAKLESSYAALNEANELLRRRVKELIRTRRRLSRKQRLALVGEAISQTSHEIQNKIGGIGIWVQNLERYGAKDAAAAECIRELKAALASSQDMLMRFKQFYRQPPLVIAEINASELIDLSLARVAPDLQSKGLTLVRENDELSMTIRIDISQMRDAVVNILLNAIHFSPDHGILTLGLHRNRDYAVLSFSDQGPGLQTKDELFQPFYTTRPNGSGLGLAITRNIIMAHSGRIRGYNRPKGGACFEIYLPLPGNLSTNGVSVRVGHEQRNEEGIRR
jgi:signal transduction histidine kinase